MSARRATLKSNTAIAAVLLTLSALFAVASLLILSSVLRSSNDTLHANVLSVHLAEETELDLLLHARARDPVARASFELEVSRKLRELQEYVANPGEREMLEESMRLAQAYFSAPDSQSLEHAYRSVDELVNINLGQADAIQRSARGMASFVAASGATAAALILLMIVLTVVWVHRSLVRPLFELSATMENYMAGNANSYAQEHGPEEIRLLAHRFNEMSRSLARQREIRLASLAGIAHDLRTPFAALQNATALADMKGASEDDLRKVLGIVRRQTNRLTRMVDDLLDSTRIETGQLELQLDLSDIRGVVAEVIELLRSAEPFNAELSLPDKPVNVHCDALRLGQVVTNLVTNAVKYSPPDAPIAVTLREERHWAILTVSDHGVGISEDQQAMIFAPFHRGNSQGSHVPGAGIGLSVVKRIVDAHGGKINVRSERNVGSSFEVLLPVVDSR